MKWKGNLDPFQLTPQGRKVPKAREARPNGESREALCEA